MNACPVPDRQSRRLRLLLRSASLSQWPSVTLVIDPLAAQIALLTEQLTLVLERLSLNSRNSSKPPSSDGPGAGMNRAQRRASERKRGAQKGHP